MINLEWSLNGGHIKVFEKGSSRKDRYSSCSYANYLADIIEKEEMKKRKSNNNDFMAFWQKGGLMEENIKDRNIVFSEKYVDEQLKSINAMLTERNYSLAKNIQALNSDINRPRQISRSI